MYTDFLPTIPVICVGEKNQFCTGVISKIAKEIKEGLIN